MQLPSSNNLEWGFYGTMENHAAEAWPAALQAVMRETQSTAECVAQWQDSADGRHFADGVTGKMAAGATLGDAITATVGQWMGWRIGRKESRETGIPAGMPYLTGRVMHIDVLANAA